MSMDEKRSQPNKNLKYMRSKREIRLFKYCKMSKSCVLIAVSIALSSSTFFGSILPGVLGASNHAFEFYWNVPTFMCHRYGMHFDEVSSFGIRQNKDDQFQGDQIAILYDPGEFPALKKNDRGHTVQINGGVPQQGNLTHHLDLFRTHVNEQIKDVDFAGLAVIDFESWRPIFRQNWASLAPYRDLSTEIERAKHPSWDKNHVAHEAARRFEKAGRLFMEDTLRFARTIRPRASWGYYAYPYCYNLTPNAPTAECDPKVYAENDRLSWMFNLQDVVLPSVYLRASLNKKERMELISGRIEEALRISNRSKHPSKKPVLSYFWYKYQDSRDGFLDSDDLHNGFKTVKNLGANGIVLWGSSNDLNSKLKCQEFKDYLDQTLGPMAWKLKVGRSQNDEESGSQEDPSTINPAATSVNVKDNESEEFTNFTDNFVTQQV